MKRLNRFTALCLWGATLYISLAHGASGGPHGAAGGRGGPGPLRQGHWPPADDSIFSLPQYTDVLHNYSNFQGGAGI